MTFRLVTAAMAAPVKAASAKLVLIALAERANDDGQCFPSIAKLAEALHLSEAQIHRRIRMLREDGIVEVTPRYDGQGRQTSNSFKLIGLLETTPGEGVISATPGCLQETGGRVSSGDTPNTNPHKEPIKPPPTPKPEPVAEQPSSSTTVGWAACGLEAKAILAEHWPNDAKLAMTPTGIIAQWMANGWTADLDILPTIRAVCADMASKGNKPGGLKYFSTPIERHYQERIASSARDGPESGAKLRSQLEGLFARYGRWQDDWPVWRDHWGIRPDRRAA